jgi:hypothetical protein
MKKLVLLSIVGLFAFGCAPAKKGTCPHREAGAEVESDKEGVAPPPPPATMPAEETKDAPDPAATGYGDDPGEETQE